MTVRPILLLLSVAAVLPVAAGGQTADLLEPTFPVFVKPAAVLEPPADDESLVLEAPGRYSWAIEIPDPGPRLATPTCPKPTETQAAASTDGFTCLDSTGSLIDAWSAAPTTPLAVEGVASPEDAGAMAADATALTEAGAALPLDYPSGTADVYEPAPGVLAAEEAEGEPLPAEGLYAAEAAAAAPSRSPSRGFNTGQLIFWSQTEIDAAVREMAATRSSVHRLTILWAHVQPDNGSQWNIQPYDRVIKAAAAHGLRLVLNPTGSPNWARRTGRTTVPYGTFGMFAYPDNLTAWGSFIARLAREYNPEGFEIWNEQNSRAFWDPTPTLEGPSASRWTTLFCRAAQAIRSVRSLETVGMGGLAPHLSTKRDTQGRLQNVKASDYVRSAYRARVGRCGLTFVGYHPYVINTYCSGRASYPTIDKAPGIVELRLVRNVMNANGQRDRRIWNTEWGFPSHRFVVTRHPDGTPRTYCTYSENLQATMIRREHEYLRRTTSLRMRFSLYFNIRDSYPDSENADPSGNAFYTIGMLRKDGSRKPSFDTWTGLP